MIICSNTSDRAHLRELVGQRKCQDSLHNGLQQECETDKGAKVYWLYNPSLSYMTGELLCICSRHGYTRTNCGWLG